MLIYTQNITNRLKYSCTVFFKNICKTRYELTEDQEYFIQYAGAKVNYTNKEALPGIQIIPAKLLFERGIKEQDIVLDEWEGVPVFYSNCSQGLIPFDVLSACFYLVTRYEEYLPFIGDEHGRFKAENSLAYQHNFLKIPVVDNWAKKFITQVNKIYPSSQFEKRKFEFIATIDVDSAYAYKNKGFIRMAGGFAKDILAFNFSNFKNRFATTFGKADDPFDTYDLLNQLHEKYEVDSLFFFLIANYGLNDKNLPHTSKKFQELIRSVADYNTIGIHPGYQSNSDATIVATEIGRLSEISRQTIEKSRQHFLMLRFPETYANLADNGILEDYTMGYASYPGFRAGTCSSYPFYNIQNETITNLRIFPFTVMDATLNKYMNKTPEEAIQILGELIDEVKSVNGTFISLWHNESLSEKWHWKGWRVVYEEMLKLN